MNLRKFLELIPKDRWTKNNDGIVRRGLSCPITSISNKDCTEYEPCAKHLGLSKKLRNDIMCAADNILSNEKTKIIRKKLLETLNLGEDP